MGLGERKREGMSKRGKRAWVVRGGGDSVGESERGEARDRERVIYTQRREWDRESGVQRRERERAGHRERERGMEREKERGTRRERERGRETGIEIEADTEAETGRQRTRQTEKEPETETVIVMVHETLHEGGVVGVVEGLAYNWAAPSPSGVSPVLPPPSPLHPIPLLYLPFPFPARGATTEETPHLVGFP